MSDRSILAPIAVLGLGAAGAWGAWHYLGPKSKGAPKDSAAAAPPPPPSAPPPPPPPPPAPPSVASSAPSVAAPPTAAPSAPSELAVGAGVSSAPPAASDRNAPSRAFDPIFSTFSFATRIPVAYFRALAWSESRLRPEVPGGLFQIMPKTRDDFARRHPEHAAALDLNSPAISTMIAADTLATIKTSLAKNHPNQLHARADWSNPHFVEMLTLAYNAGWSEASGVGRALGYFDGAGYYSARTDDIATHARKIGGLAKWLEEPRRFAYARLVASRFTGERKRDEILKAAAAFDPTGLVRKWGT